MKLFYITNARLPNDKGHGIQIVKMAEAFHKKIGSSFQLVVPDKAQPKGFSNSIKDFYSLKEEIPINKLNIADPMFLSRFLPEVFERPLFDLQILFFGIISFVFAISRDGTFYTRDFYLVPFLLFAGKKVYYEAHYFPTTKAAIFFHRLLIPKLTGVIVLTKSFKTNYDNFGFKYRRLLVSPDATDPEFFKIKKIKHPKLIIGYIGRLSGLGEDKGGNILINAFRSLKSKKCELLVVGEKEKDRVPGVTFAGTLPYKKMPYYFNLIDIAVIPFPDRPHFRYFMSPLKLFDYLACGKPIITSDLPSIREILTEDNAVFFKPGDITSLAYAMEKLLLNKDIRLRMSKNNIELGKKYIWDKRVGLIYDFICQ